MSLDQQFNTISDKLQLLLKQYGRLQKENERLKEELQQASDREAQARQQAESMSEQIGILRLASGDLPEKDKKEFEKKLNQYIREIDRYISFLSQ